MCQLGRRPKPIRSMTRFSTPDGLRTPILRLESELAQEQSPTLALISQPHPPLGLVSTVPADGMIIHFLFDTTSFISNFIIGPSIAEGMRTSLQTRFFVSPETQLAGFLAFASEYATRCGRLVLSAQTNMP